VTKNEHTMNYRTRRTMSNIGTNKNNCHLSNKQFAYIYIKKKPSSSMYAYSPQLKCVQWTADKRINNTSMTCGCNNGYFFKEIWGIKNGLRKYSDIL
jgi:hypothetical protein